jgi:hypothetical protein
MSKFFSLNPDIKNEFEKLPNEVKTRIIESGVSIKTVEELQKVAKSVMESFK